MNTQLRELGRRFRTDSPQHFHWKRCQECRLFACRNNCETERRTCPFCSFLPDLGRDLCNQLVGSNPYRTRQTQFGGGSPISWFDWAAKIFEAAGLNPPLKPTNEREFRTAARRPKYSALSNGKMEALGLDPMPTLDQAIRMYLKAREERMAAK